MFETFYQKYIELNLADFFDIGFDFKINKVLFFAFLGIIVACIITNYIESGITVTLKRLLRTESHSEECARTLADLGLKDSRCAKIAIERRGGMTARLILATGEKTPTYEEYVAEEKRLRDEKKAKRKARLNKILGVFKKSKATNDGDSDAPDTAKDTVSDRGVTGESNCSVSLDVTDNTAGTEVITDVTADAKNDTDTENNTDVEKRYYIPEEMVDSAKRYLTRHAPTVGKTVLSCVLILGFYLLLAYLMPTFIDLVLALT